jgi:hypothetical protein
MLAPQPMTVTATPEDLSGVSSCFKWFTAILSHKQGHLSVFPFDYDSISVISKEAFFCFKCSVMLNVSVMGSRITLSSQR